MNERDTNDRQTKGGERVLSGKWLLMEDGVGCCRGRVSRICWGKAEPERPGSLGCLARGALANGMGKRAPVDEQLAGRVVMARCSVHVVASCDGGPTRDKPTGKRENNNRTGN